MKEKFTNMVDKEINGESSIIFYFCIIAVIIGVILSFSFHYSKEPTQKDYLDLINKQNVLINNFNEVYNLKNTTIYTSKESIVVSTTGNNCEMKAYFNKDKEYLYSEKVNTNTPLICYMLIFAIIFFMIGFLVYSFLMVICLFIYYIINYRNKK